MLILRIFDLLLVTSGVGMLVGFIPLWGQFFTGTRKIIMFGVDHPQLSMCLFIGGIICSITLFILIIMIIKKVITTIFNTTDQTNPSKNLLLAFVSLIQLSISGLSIFTSLNLYWKKTDINGIIMKNDYVLMKNVFTLEEKQLWLIEVRKILSNLSDTTWTRLIATLDLKNLETYPELVTHVISQLKLLNYNDVELTEKTNKSNGLNLMYNLVSSGLNWCALHPMLTSLTIFTCGIVGYMYFSYIQSMFNQVANGFEHLSRGITANIKHIEQTQLLANELETLNQIVKSTLLSQKDQVALIRELEARVLMMINKLADEHGILAGDFSQFLEVLTDLKEKYNLL
jgi:hypothetical protein